MKPEIINTTAGKGVVVRKELASRDKHEYLSICIVSLGLDDGDRRYGVVLHSTETGRYVGYARDEGYVVGVVAVTGTFGEAKTEVVELKARMRKLEEA